MRYTYIISFSQVLWLSDRRTKCKADFTHHQRPYESTPIYPSAQKANQWMKSPETSRHKHATSMHIFQGIAMVHWHEQRFTHSR
ncbi:hypothetical protein EYC84_005774 [Monilinia fructicola]|uniref:Uncharacterized protein n=1 Tax=Monilinia fructicola TaxID=38448 RepID=A0A5M9K1I2_MONFR|nr:hypothetical protein EYC84_005774 [Monilinia fructicola]